MSDSRSRAQGKPMHVELAQNDRAGFCEPCDDFGIFIRDALRKHGARRSRQHARRIDVVFERNRNPVQRAPPPPLRQLRLQFPCARDGTLFGQRDKGVEPNI